MCRDVNLSAATFESAVFLYFAIGRGNLRNETDTRSLEFIKLIFNLFKWFLGDVSLSFMSIYGLK
jgi:hypothetical protein